MTESLLNSAAPAAEIAATETVAAEAITPTASISESKSIDVLSMMSDELKGISSMEKFSGKSIDDLAKSYINLEQLVSKKVSTMSGEDLSMLDSVRGIPKAAEEYDFGGLDIDVGNFKEIFKANGLSQKQATELVSAFAENQKATEASMIESSQKAHAQNVLDLQKEFGAAYEQRIALANRAALSLGGDDLVKSLVEGGLGANPHVIKALAKVGSMMEEDTIPESMKTGTFGLTPVEAKKQIDSLLRDNDFKNAYVNHRDPKHKAAVEQIMELYALL